VAAGKGWTQLRYMPRLADYRGTIAEIPFDFHRADRALAPRHVLLCAAAGPQFPLRQRGSDPAAARPIFELYGNPAAAQSSTPTAATISRGHAVKLPTSSRQLPG